MAVYYNEFDPYAAQWLRNLIAKGLMPVPRRVLFTIQGEQA